MRTLIISFLFISLNVSATEPNILICKSYGFSSFYPKNSKGERIEVFEEADNWSSDDSTLYFYLNKKRLEFTTEDGHVVEILTKAAPMIYISKGTDKGTDYFGVYTFSDDFSIAQYSSAGNFSEYSICKAIKG